MAVFRVGLLSRVQGLKQPPGMMLPGMMVPGPELQVPERKPEPGLVSELGLLPEPGLVPEQWFGPGPELPGQGRLSGSKVSSK